MKKLISLFMLMLFMFSVTTSIRAATPDLEKSTKIEYAVKADIQSNVAVLVQNQPVSEKEDFVPDKKVQPLNIKNILPLYQVSAQKVRCRYQIE